MPRIDNVAYAKMMNENAQLKEQIKNLAEKVMTLVTTGKELQESTAVLMASVDGYAQRECGADEWEPRWLCGAFAPKADADKSRWTVYDQTWNETVAQRTERERLEQEQEGKYKTIEERDALWRRQHEEDVGGRVEEKCSYCGKMEPVCDGDHGDDMRWEQAENRSRRL